MRSLVIMILLLQGVDSAVGADRITPEQLAKLTGYPDAKFGPRGCRNFGSMLVVDDVELPEDCGTITAVSAHDQ